MFFLKKKKRRVGLHANIQDQMKIKRGPVQTHPPPLDSSNHADLKNQANRAVQRNHLWRRFSFRRKLLRQWVPLYDVRPIHQLCCGLYITVVSPQAPFNYSIFVSNGPRRAVVKWFSIL